MDSKNIRISKTKPEEKDSLIDIARSTGVFNDEEIMVIDELIVEYITKGPEVSGYHFLSERSGNEVLGFACYGPRPMTEGTYDLYWLAIRKGVSGGGLGKRLVNKVVQKVRKSGGRMLVAETSGKPDYAPTRRFYIKQHFEQAAVITDFYSPEDDLFIFIRRF
jgi:GNAT superfamily N-acetyltransferase